MSLPWFRLYNEAVDDPKLRLLAFEDRWHYVAILCCKGQGILDKNETMRERMLSLKLGVQIMEMGELKRRLTEVGLIDANWQPVAWDKRQFVSDISTGRVRKYRNNKETGNVSETAGNRFGNAPDTEQNRTDTEQIQNRKKHTKSLPGTSNGPLSSDARLAQAKLTPERQRKMPTALKNYSAASLCQASDARPVPDVQIVFAHWQNKLNHSHAKLTPERQRKISTALKNYSAASLCQAIDGCAVTPHNMGENDRCEVYDDIALIVRDASHVERFMRNATSPPKSNGGNHAASKTTDNSAPARVKRANDQRERERKQSEKTPIAGESKQVD